MTIKCGWGTLDLTTSAHLVTGRVGSSHTSFGQLERIVREAPFKKDAPPIWALPK